MDDLEELSSGGFREDADLLAGVLQTSPVGITVVDADGEVSFANERAEEIYGRTREEITGFSHDDPRWGLVDADGEPLGPDEAPFERVLEREAAIYDQVVGLRRPSGERVWVSVNAAPQWDADGDLRRVVFAFEDVTERRQRERELARYETLFEESKDVNVIVEPDGTFRYLTPSAANVFGYEPEELVGENGFDYIHPDDRERAMTEFAEMIESADYEPQLEFRFEHADGSYIVLEALARDLRDDPDIEGVVVYTRNITDLRRRERDLEETEQRYRALVEHFPNGAVALVDEDLRYRTVGGEPPEAVDATPAEAEGRPVSEVVPPDVAEELVPSYEAAFEGDSSTFEVESDGRIHQFRVVPVRDRAGEIFAALGMSQDVTERVETQRELEESERRYRTLVENFPDGSVGLFDEDLRYTAVGGQLLEELGISPEEVVGTSIYARYPDDLIDEIRPNFSAVFDGESSSFEIELEGRHLHAQTLPVRNVDDEIYAGMLLVQDVTERKERERELERALDLLNKTERIADVAGWEVDPETEEPYWTDHLFTLLDVEYDEQPSLDEALDVYHTEDDRRVVEEAVEEALETGDSFDVEARFPRPEGDVGWLRVKGDPEVVDGEVVSLRGAVQDVTERKEREQALQESRNQLRALIDVLPVAVFVAEADGEIVEWNEAAEEVWGGEVVESESVAEYEEYEAWWADTGEPVEPEEWPLARALEGEEVTDPDEIRIKGFDGKLRTVLNHGMPVRNADGEVTRAVVTLVDITERKEYQRRLEESNERLEQFAYAASHDLQEPLRMVSSYLQLLENRYVEELDEEAEEYIEFAVDGADRMREMIDGLLQYSRVETRGNPLEAVDLGAIFEEAREDLRLSISEADAEITVDGLPRVEGDASQLRQVFQNLLENAVEYSGDEPPRIHVDAERRGDEWLVSVADEGIGIEPEDQEDVFEVFQRLHSREEHEGTGIGLALCERIVERHGGDIWVESEPGEGATFYFTLPAADAES